MVFKNDAGECFEYIIKTLQGRIFVSEYKLSEDTPELFFADKVILKCRLKNIGFQNVYEKYLYNSYNIDKIAIIEDVISVVPSNRLVDKLYNKFFTGIFYLRNVIIDYVKKTIPSPYNNLILRITIGYKDTELNEIEKYFQSAGVIHVLVVSGLHVGFVYLFLYTFLKFVIIFPREIKIILSMFGVILYTLLTGCSPPVVRATIILVCFCITLLLKREHSVYHSLSLAAIIILISNPRNLFNPSFQLSFCACFGISYYYRFLNNKIKEYLEKINFIVRYIVQLFLVTFSAQIFTLPLVMYYFNKISIVGLISNIIIIPISSVMLWLGLGYYTTLLIPNISYPMARIVTFCYSIYLEIIKFFSNLPFSVINTFSPSSFSMLVYFLILLVIPRYSFKIKTIIFGFLISVTILFINITPAKYKHRITFLNVGLGDCVIIFDDDKVCLIDTGGELNFDVGKYIVSAYLLKNKVKEIEYVIISHPHYPHYFGLKYLLENFFKIKNIVINNFVSSEKEYKELLRIAYNKKINLIVIKNKQYLKLKNIQLTIIPSYVWQATDEISIYDENSMLIKLKYNKFSCLLTNDLPMAQVINLLKHEKLNTDFTLLQIPRHGKYKEDIDLLSYMISKKYLSTKFCIVSTDKSVWVSKLKNFGIPLFSTSSNGNIEVLLKNSHIMFNLENFSLNPM